MVRQTNGDGRFSFSGLWGSEWELSAACSGFAPGRYRATRYDPRRKFSLAKDQQIKDIVLKLIPQAVAAGRVLDGDRKPVEGAHVSLMQARYTAGVRIGRRRPQRRPSTTASIEFRACCPADIW
jgi:hypothetical protein